MAYIATHDTTVHVPVGLTKSEIGLFSSLPRAADDFSEAIS